MNSSTISKSYEITSEQLQALEEMERRVRIRRDLTSWCQHAGYEPAAHHRLILDALGYLSASTLLPIMCSSGLNPLQSATSSIPGGMQGNSGVSIGTIAPTPGRQRRAAALMIFMVSIHPQPANTAEKGGVSSPTGSHLPLRAYDTKNGPKERSSTNQGLKIDRLAIFMPPGSAKST